ncbi:MAG: trypsin-like peptidase domain-containing protein [Bacteroidota bacterium]|nr:MAG: trypsin-like peptidase domain-containing protein [Bacteroidota bacterium]
MTSSMGEEIKLTNGIISSKTGFKGDISSYQVSAPVQPGNSGGPLFDKNGNLIGIVSAKHSLAENASYAVKVSYLKSLIELLPQSINQSTLNTLSGKGLTEQVKIASNYTYLIVINDKGNSYRSSNNNTTPKKSSTSEQNAEIYYQKAQELWENRDHKGALEQINLSIDASPNYAGSYYFRGFIYLYGIRNYEKAVDDFTKSIQMQSDFEEAYFFRGMAFHDLEKNIEAMKDFTKVISMNKENTDAYFMRALIKSNMNDKQGAISDYDEIIKREKSAEPSVYDMATVYNNKAYCLVELDKSNEALPFVNKALDLEKSLWYIWDTRGEIYYKLAQYNEAIKDMNKAIGIEEHDNSFYIRGLARIKLGQNESGCKDLSKAGELGEIKAYDAMKQHCK